jgi:hypothetical protein
MSRTYRQGYNKFKDKMTKHSPDGSWNGQHCCCDFCLNLRRHQIKAKDLEKINVLSYEK